MDFLYRHYPANYTTIREYWLKKDTTCDFIVDSDNYLDWYITDVSAEYQYWVDNGRSCKVEIDRWTKYEKRTHMKVGPQNERGGGFVCLIKYRIKNKNKVHDLRTMIARGQDNTPDPIIEGSAYIKPVSFVISLFLGFLMYSG